MNKIEFILALSKKLEGLPPQEWEDRRNFYLEAIDDRMEEGLSEEEAVAALGTIDAIVAEILADIPFTHLLVKKITPDHRLARWKIVLLVLGTPLWLSLFAAAFAAIVSVYASLWSVIVSLWASEIALMGASLGSLISGIALMVTGSAARGLFLVGAGSIIAGLSIFLFLACKEATKAIVRLTKKMALFIKKLFIRKENNK